MSVKLPIYLDYSATTPVDPRVAQKMIPYLTEFFGNPASRSHAFGWKAEEAVEEARGHVAALIGADPKEIVWTSGATEGNNLAIKGAAHFYKTKGRHLITQKTEHKAVLDTFRELERQGFEATRFQGLVAILQMKGRMALQVIEVGADESGFLHANAIVPHEIGDAAGWIDAVIGAVRNARLRGDSLHPALQSLLDHDDARHARVGRAGGDVELHRGWLANRTLPRRLASAHVWRRASPAKASA